MTRTELALDVRNVSKRFGGQFANRDINLRVERGEIRGLIGPNGAGKTTLTNLISGIYPPTSGEILMDGHNLVGLTPHQISLKGLIRSFQVPRLFGNLSVQENLLIPHYARARFFSPNLRRGREKANELLHLVGLEQLRAAPAKQLSGGQQALLQIAVGFMCDNMRCYLLDEAFAGVNPVIKDTIIDLILHERQTREVTFLVISHEMSTVRRLCDRVTVLAAGTVLTEGSMDEVTANETVIDAYLGRTWV